jgi:uncharacterized protein DUF1016
MKKIVQQPVAQIPWGHNVCILDLVRIPEYAKATTQRGWSRNVLLHQIESDGRRRIQSPLRSITSRAMISGR